MQDTRQRVDSAECSHAAVHLNLLDLPTELLLEVLRTPLPSCARLTCRTLRAHLDTAHEALRLFSLNNTFPTPPETRPLASLDALLHCLPNLRSLDSGQHPFASLAFLSSLPRLECLSLIDVDVTSEQLLPVTSLSRLTRLSVQRGWRITAIDALAALTALRSLDLSQCDAVPDLAPLLRCPQLTALLLSPRCPAAEDLTFVEDVPQLAALTLFSDGLGLGFVESQEADLGPLAALQPSLTLLDMEDHQVYDLTPLSGMRLQHLRLFCSAEVDCLTPALASSLPSLTVLRLYAPSIHDISPLTACAALRLLDLGSLHSLVDVRALSALTALTHLKLTDCDRVTDLTPLAALRSCLLRLSLNGSAGAADAVTISACTSLTHLNLLQSGVTCVAPLAACVQLRMLCIRRCHLVAGFAALRAACGPLLQFRCL